MQPDWYRCDGRGFANSSNQALPASDAASSAPLSTAPTTLPITRRQALRGGAMAAIAWSCGSHSALADVVFDATQSPHERAQFDETRPVLVTIFLRGGADGLNMVVPHGDADYLRARPTLGLSAPRGAGRKGAVGSDRVLDLDGFFGFHPSLAPLLPFYREGRLAGVHACGSHDESRSHFEAMATLECGRDGDENNNQSNLPEAIRPSMAAQSTLKALAIKAAANGIGSADAFGPPDANTTAKSSKATKAKSVATTGATATGGWLARHLASAPSPTASPLRAVAFGGTMPESLRGATDATALESLSDFHLALPTAWQGQEKKNAFHDTLAALYRDGGDDIARAGRETLQVLHSINRLDPAHYSASHGAQYPASELGVGLKQVACLIGAGVGLEVACLDRGGWDTHIAQGSSAGWMASQLDDVAQSLAAFARDLGPQMNRVTVVVLSEFGRRVGENGGLGTDHGRAGAMLILGGAPNAKGAVRGGRVYGQWPGLSASQLEPPGDLRVTTDYRDVLGEIAVRRLKNPHLDAIFPNHQPQFLGLIAS